jgi:hypothetical protein
LHWTLAWFACLSIFLTLIGLLWQTKVFTLIYIQTQSSQTSLYIPTNIPIYLYYTRVW